MSNQTEWRWADPTGQQRLVREDELRAALASGVIPANAPVWTRGWNGWRPAHEVPELTGKANGTSVPPPPTFVMAAKDAFEGKPTAAGPAEPPPPPRYIPLAASTIPTPLDSDTRVDAPVVVKSAPAKPPTKPPPLPPGANKPAPKKSIPPPLPPAARKPTPGAMQAVKPPAPTAGAPIAKVNLTKTAVSPGTATRPLPQQQSTFTKTQRPPAGVAPPAIAIPSGPPSGSRTTLQVAPAPPPMPKLDPLPRVAEPTPQKEPSSKFPTLMMFDGNEPAPPAASTATPSSDEAPPIVVPPPEPSAVTNAVTRPPPWGEGAVEVQTMFPKSPRVPNVERPSEAPPRPQELSSSDLTSEARIEVVKAPPLAAVERPHATMLGLGPDALAENRAVLERAAMSPPPAPLSASDVASTKKLAAADDTEPKLTAIPEPSGAKLHDLRELARDRMSRAYADLRERTKGRPSWFLPAIAGGGALLVVILLIAGIKAVSGSSDVQPTASTSTGSSTASHAGTGATVTTPQAAKGPPARPMTCSTAGAARTVAPKAVVASGVEVAPVGNQLALGFAVAPKEATLEIVDASSLASASALHLKSTDNVRRVLALDASKAAVDADHKGDKLQGRRTVRGATPLDLGAMDGGLAWAPHGSDKGIKLWSLANPDAPVEALRGEPLPNGKGYAVAFRHAGAIWFGAFGGTPPAPLAGLMKIEGLGPQIGSPALAVSGERVMVAWADRAGTSDPWGVRWAMFHPGDESAQAKPFAPPPGGLGEHAMSPGLASLGSGRFLLVWTEGPVSSHQVRGITIGENGTFGDAFTASADGVNAGQGQAAVLEGGHGAVAFLAGSGKTFEVAATPIQCVEK